MRIPPCGDYGDVNSDGYVTDEDSKAAAQHYYGAELFPDGQLSGGSFARADVDGDGLVTMGDAAMIRGYADGTTRTFPICGVYGDRPARRILAVAVVALVLLYILTR